MTVHDDLLGPDVIEDPYTYFGRLREEDPVHWNALYDTWVITRLEEYINPFIDERAVHPRDDLLSLMAAGEREGTMSRDEVIGNLFLLLIAGHQTTINLIGNGILALMRHPAQWARLKRDPSLIVKATEELLRYDGPVKRAPRLAAADFELGGKMIRTSERVLIVLSSANRDPRRFTDPDTLDITRYPNPHVAFGGGIHHCLGANLARLEGQEAIKALVQRFPPCRLETEILAYQPLLTLRALTCLPISWQ